MEELSADEQRNHTASTGNAKSCLCQSPHTHLHCTCLPKTPSHIRSRMCPASRALGCQKLRFQDSRPWGRILAPGAGERWKGMWGIDQYTTIHKTVIFTSVLLPHTFQRLFPYHHIHSFQRSSIPSSFPLSRYSLRLYHL